MKRQSPDSRGGHRRWLIRSPEVGSAVDPLEVGEHEIGADLERRLWESDEGFERGLAVYSVTIRIQGSSKSRAG